MVQLLPHAVDSPLIVLPILHPFEIAGRDAAGVGKDVRQDNRAALGQDFVGIGLGGGVGPFDDDRGFDPGGVFRGDHAAQRRGDQ